LNDEVNKQSFDANLESSRSQQSEDYEVYQYENSITTESPVPVVTKRISIHSQKVSSGSQEHVQVNKFVTFRNTCCINIIICVYQLNQFCL
jgi:hypothetical protein